MATNFEKIYSYMKKNFKDFQVIMINDGSTDDTRAIATKIAKAGKNVDLIDYNRNQGKGYAVKQGILASKGDIVIFCDIDLSTPIEETQKLLKYEKKYEIVIGSRALKMSRIQKRQKWYRVVLGKMGNKIIQLLLLPGIKDTQCGFKMFKGKTARSIFRFLTINRWGFDFEMLYLAKKNGVKIKEVPIDWHDEEDSKLSIKDYITTLLELLKIKWKDLTGKYE